MQKLSNPVPIFLDTTGALLDGGSIYVGVAHGDPENEPIDLFWDAALSVPALQPLRTIGGLIVNGVTPADVFHDEDDFSMRVRDAQDVQVFYSRSVYSSDSGFQPLDADLTAIAALTTTAYGRGLLTLANQAALAAAVGYSPFVGGTVTSNITRQGAGTHLYWTNSALTSGRVFQIDEGDPDPSSLPGDWVVELEP